MRASAAFTLCLASPLMAQEKSARPSIYDKNADAIAMVDAAVKRAARDNKRRYPCKRVLVLVSSVLYKPVGSVTETEQGSCHKEA